MLESIATIAATCAVSSGGSAAARTFTPGATAKRVTTFHPRSSSALATNFASHPASPTTNTARGVTSAGFATASDC